MQLTNNIYYYYLFIFDIGIIIIFLQDKRQSL